MKQNSCLFVPEIENSSLRRAMRPTRCLRSTLAGLAAVLLLAAPSAHATDTFNAALDCDPPLSFTSSGDLPWFIQTSVTNDGVDALQSGAIGANQTSVLTAQITGPVYVNFKFKTSCEGYSADYLSYGVDGNLNYIDGGELPWLDGGPLPIPPGVHTLTWKYQKNGSVNTGSDCAWLDQLTTTPASAPANDNFADKIDLGNTAPQTVSADNTFASTETGEDIFPAFGVSSGASLWWSWTAPSTGYAKFEILSSPSFYGVVGAYTGDNLLSLTRIGWSAGSLSYPGTPASLIFPVTSGQTYRLVVHGLVFSGTQTPYRGPFSFSVSMVSAPGVRLTGLTVEPDPSLDVTSTPGTGYFNVSISSDVAFTSGSCQLYRPDGQSFANLSIVPANLTSGNAFNGTYRISTTIPSHAPPGNYALENIQLTAGSFTSTYGANLSAGVYNAPNGVIDGTLLVTNTGQADTSPPQLVYATISPPSVNIHSAAQTVTVDVSLTDLAGFARGFVYFYRPDGSYATAAQLPATPWSGNANAGIYRVTYQVPVGALTGTWTIRVIMTDVLHYQSLYGGPTGLPFPNGPTEGTFTVINSNDQFANRFDLGSAATVTTTGTSVGATMETGETYTGTWGGASVWWSWTAPASGWTQIDTSGSAINTVVGVYTGTAVASLTPVGWNVYAASPATGSKLVFQATVGTVYQIAVLGRAATGGGFEQGNVTLNIHNPATLPCELTSVTPGPGSLNVTSASGSTTFTFAASIPAGFSSGYYYFYDPNFNLLTWGVFGTEQRVSGDATNGTYQISLGVPAHAPPGEYLVELDFTDTGGNSAYYSNGLNPWADHVLAAGDFTVTVIDTDPDTQPPVLSAISFAPATLNVASGSATGHVDLTVSDLPAGFSHGSLWIYNPDGILRSPTVSFNADQRTSGNAQSGVYHVPFTLLSSDPTGTWHVEVRLHDALNQRATYDSTNMPGGASAAQFSVISSAGSTYADWASPYFAPEEMATIGALGYDADGDGIPNGVEAVMGTHPREGSSRGTLTPAMDDNGGSHLTLHFQRAETLPSDLTIVVRTNPDLDPLHWTTLTQKTGSGPWSVPAAVVEGSASGGLVPVTVHAPPGSGARLFMRLEVVQSAP